MDALLQRDPSENSSLHQPQPTETVVLGGEADTAQPSNGSDPSAGSAANPSFQGFAAGMSSEPCL